ncbi:MAG: hypothetical protein U0360_09755 [Dehalococcoidia bacterium]
MTIAFIAAAWLLSRPQFGRGAATQSFAALALAGLTMVSLFYFQRFQ